MSRKAPRVTAYVAAAPPFARPILKAIRAAMHAGCPTLEETVKWGMPALVHHGLIGGMAAFKAHCTLWFWRGGQLASLGPGKGGAMGQFGRRGEERPEGPRIRQHEPALGGGKGPRPEGAGDRVSPPPDPC
jgi:hypothetical protein